jgi:hypothetical protein
LQPSLRTAFLFADHLPPIANKKVFNTTVDKTVEKHGSIFVSDSAKDGSALCTDASAGTFVLQPLVRGNSRSMIYVADKL